ncbi:acyl dehydratase [Rhizobium rosettiformans]|uniref:MaoC family dehydratase n=2 Tax=Rhizobium rosettiformans TaxID=1368430 RepID=A0A4V4HQW1_9HYPH|nr:MaoC family dehydratase [Rhizobium rosettiformans]MBB5276783.1 acyl dehydratase [Rhizobium rosettiformans]THV35376.1 MaoC family dehydratase [Rhizobium rosettiformans W3]
MKLLDLYPPGTRLELGSVTFTADDIIRFAEKFDPQPFHVDAEAAKTYVFGALCASGWHTCANWMKSFIGFITREITRLKTEGIAPPKLGPSPGFAELQWLKPVYAGDTITFFMTPIDSRTVKGRHRYILNSALSEGVNQNGETVLRFKSNLIEFFPDEEPMP